MEQKKQKIVNAPHKFFAMLVGKTKNNKLQNTTEKLLNTSALSFVQVKGFLEWATQNTILDNRLIQTLKKEFNSIQNIKNKAKQEIAIKKILKKYPKARRALINWLMITGSFIAGANIGHNDKEQNSKKTIVKVVKDQSVVNPIKPIHIDVNEDNYITKAIDLYFPSLLIGLAELETCVQTPTLFSSEERYTYYLGLTWVYERDRTGKIIPHKCDGEWRKKAHLFTDQEKQQQLKMHLEYNTVKALQRISKKLNIIHDYETSIGLLWAGYQRPNDMKGISELLLSATTPQEKADAFMYYKGPARYKKVTLKRRWFCAAYALGVINDNDLLNMHRDAYVDLDINTYCETDVDGSQHFLFDTETVSKILGIKNKNDLVKDFVGRNIKPVDKEKLAYFEAEVSKLNMDNKSKKTSFNVASSKITKNVKNKWHNNESIREL